MVIDYAGAKVNSKGELIFSPDPEARKIFFQEVFETPEGLEYLPHKSKESIERIVEVVQKWYPGDQELTVPMFCAVVRALLDTRDPAIFPPEPEVEPEPERPRRPDGKYKSEFEIYADSHSMVEIRARVAIDGAFGAWFRSTYNAQTIQKSEYTVLAGHQPSASESTDLQTFVSYLKQMSREDRRPRGGFIQVGDRKYTLEGFRHQTDLAIAAGLW